MGTPACGRNTISSALVSRFKLGIHIPVDDVRHMVVGGLSDMQFETRESANASDLQIRLARESLGIKSKRPKYLSRWHKSRLLRQICVWDGVC